MGKMRYLFLALIAALFAGCRTATPDPINHLVTDLSATHGLWINGLVSGVNLPQTATPGQVVEQIFKTRVFENGHVTDFKILEIRQVHIQSYPQGFYTAVLVQTNLGEKIVLIRFEGHPGYWWNRVYDANQAHYY